MGAITEIDRNLFLALNGDAGSVMDAIMHALTWLADGVVLGPILLVVIVALRRSTLVASATFVAATTMGASMITWIWKHLALRPRPLAELGDAVVHVVGKRVTELSFPSGHATMAMASAVALGFLFPRWRWPFIAVAVLCGYSRIYVGAHFPLDVIAGFAVGATTGIVVHVLMEKTGIRSRLEEIRWPRKASS